MTHRLAPQSQRSQISCKLSTVQVYAVTQVVLERQVRFEGDEVQGKTEAGRVVIDEKDNSLDIFISTQDLAAGNLPVWLISEKLSMICGVGKDSQKKNLLTSILAINDPVQIEDMLENNRVEPLLSGDKKSNIVFLEDEISVTTTDSTRTAQVPLSFKIPAMVQGDGSYKSFRRSGTTATQADTQPNGIRTPPETPPRQSGGASERYGATPRPARSENLSAETTTQANKEVYIKQREGVVNAAKGYSADDVIVVVEPPTQTGQPRTDADNAHRPGGIQNSGLKRSPSKTKEDRVFNMEALSEALPSVSGDPAGTSFLDSVNFKVGARSESHKQTHGESRSDMIKEIGYQGELFVSFTALAFALPGYYANIENRFLKFFSRG